MDMYLRLSVCILVVVTLSGLTHQNSRTRRQGKIFNIGDSCITPRNVAGVCINIRECPLHLDYLTNKRKDPSILKYLQDAVCLKQGSQVFTCCPQEKSGTCQTPKKVTGKCISIRECPELRSMLDRFREPGVADYLKASQCGINKGDPLVCCPNQSEGLPGIDVCGISNNVFTNKVVNGIPSSLGAWPWMVALGYSTPAAKLLWICGGTLITDRYVVTAAHCVTNLGRRKLIVARVGDLNLDDSVMDNATPEDISIEKSFAHENYNALANIIDIGLVKLSRRVKFTGLIRPICLPVGNLFEPDLTGYSPFIAGWGSTKYKGPTTTVLQEAQVDITTTEKCAADYKDSKGATIDNRVICAQSPFGKDACQGDSGGPLMLPTYVGDSLNYYQIGVVSYGFKCAEAGFPGVYTRMDLYIDWIKKNIS